MKSVTHSETWPTEKIGMRLHYTNGWRLDKIAVNDEVPGFYKFVWWAYDPEGYAIASFETLGEAEVWLQEAT